MHCSFIQMCCLWQEVSGLRAVRTTLGIPQLFYSCCEWVDTLTSATCWRCDSARDDKNHNLVTFASPWEAVNHFQQSCCFKKATCSGVFWPFAVTVKTVVVTKKHSCLISALRSSPPTVHGHNPQCINLSVILLLLVALVHKGSAQQIAQMT